MLFKNVSDFKAAVGILFYKHIFFLKVHRNVKIDMKRSIHHWMKYSIKILNEKRNVVFVSPAKLFLSRLWSIAAHRDHFVWRLSVRLCVRLSGSHIFLVVTHSYVSQATHAFLGMLPLCLKILWKSYEYRSMQKCCKNDGSVTQTSLISLLHVHIIGSCLLILIQHTFVWKSYCFPTFQIWWSCATYVCRQVFGISRVQFRSTSWHPCSLQK